jgi:hypothetical protein
MPAVNQTMTQICSSEMPTDNAALWLSADRAQAPADPGLLEEYRKRRDHERGDDGGRDVDLLERHEAAEHFPFSEPFGSKGRW